MDKHLTSARALKVLSIIIVFCAWEYAGRIPVSPAFPTFLETMQGLWEITIDGSLLRAYPETLKPLILGVAISAVLGITIGVAIGLSFKVEWFASPIFVVMQSAPLAALIPLLVLAYGIGLTSKVMVVCIMAMPVIVLNSANAVRHTPTSIKEMGRSFLGSPMEIIFKIILPSAAPVIFAGLRLGVSAGFIGAILSELLITPTGIGDVITYNQAIAEYAKMYAAIFSIIVLAVVFLDVIEKIELTLFRPDKRVSA
ncbi:ABC transporter permease subunit [Roseibium polysiphoniae]|uniref:ABC transporter permease subunit n=1 Tax=Roseibium polysiphoniae TaxID=2571221 RepID=A0A944CC96_9HYPH|nr:ABC transporter permease subunit [Roseibium polysiphoniae]MBD8877155.1 ABC transporter permease subunit [Roseibium polysiphoniae]MBS8260666.1 ABC transporter permease subunit [Roseibium polysiphoniae]